MNNIDYKNIDLYQEWTRSTAVYPEQVSFQYLRSGLVAEVGEYMDKIAKLYRGDNLYISSEELENGLKKELGDILWFVVRLADEHGWKMSSLLADNISKLESRKQRNVLKGSGDDR